MGPLWESCAAPLLTQRRLKTVNSCSQITKNGVFRFSFVPKFAKRTSKSPIPIYVGIWPIKRPIKQPINRAKLRWQDPLLHACWQTQTGLTLRTLHPSDNHPTKRQHKEIRQNQLIDALTCFKILSVTRFEAFTCRYATICRLVLIMYHAAVYTLHLAYIVTLLHLYDRTPKTPVKNPFVFCLLQLPRWLLPWCAAIFAPGTFPDFSIPFTSVCLLALLALIYHSMCGLMLFFFLCTFWLCLILPSFGLTKPWWNNEITMTPAPPSFSPALNPTRQDLLNSTQCKALGADVDHKNNDQHTRLCLDTTWLSATPCLSDTCRYQTPGEKIRAVFPTMDSPRVAKHQWTPR